VAAALRAYEERGPRFPTNLASLFIVSGVAVSEGETTSVRAERARGGKCERCWTYSEGVGREHAGVCERCAGVLGGR
jgi:isoleucyl-tRNA synthetase